MNNTRVHQVISTMVFAACSASVALADTLEVPDAYTTIQEAIDAAVDGDTVLVADGTYSGPGNRDLDFGGRAITLQCEERPAVCTIDIQADAGDPHCAFRFHSGETADSIVHRFTIENGFMDRGGAVLCELDSSPLFQSCVFQQNTAWTDSVDDGGGAVYNLGSSPTFADCHFIQNHTEANTLYAGGGAVHNQSGSNPTFIGCTFSENTSFGPEQSDGGAVAIWDGGHPEFFSCTFSANQAYWDAAVFLSSGGVTMHDCHFQDNPAVGGSGGAYGQDGGNSTFVNCSFIGNSAQGAAGGAVRLEGGTTTFTNCLFADNQTTANGGALMVKNGTQAVAINCLFQGNQANRGGAIRVVADSLAQIDNCTFVQNVAAIQGGGVSISGNAESVTVSNSILWNNAPEQIFWNGGLLSVTYSDIEGGWGGTGNINEDPLFVDGYRLAAGSLCIDAADNMAVPMDITTDLDGNPRFVDDPDTTPDCPQEPGTCGDAPVVDMGSYEFQLCPADLDGDGAIDAFDLALLLGSWGPCDGCPADLDGDGMVAAFDLALLLGNWGLCQ